MIEEFVDALVRPKPPPLVTPEQRLMAITLRRIYSASMTANELKTLPLAEKIQLMEALWQDLRERFERMELSDSQKTLLDRRRAAVESEDSHLHDWDAVKASIGRA